MRSVRPAFLALFALAVSFTPSGLEAQSRVSVAPVVHQYRDATMPNLWLRHENITSASFNNFQESNQGKSQLRAARIGFFNPPNTMELYPPAPSETVRLGGVDTGVRLSDRLWQHIVVQDAPAIRKPKDYTIAMLIEPSWDNRFLALASKATDSYNYSLMWALMPIPQEQNYRLAFYTNLSGWMIAWTYPGARDYDEFKILPGRVSHVAASFGNCFRGWDNNEYCNITLYINGRAKIYRTMRPSNTETLGLQMGENIGNLRIGSWYGYLSHLSQGRSFSDQLPAAQRVTNFTPSAHPEYNFKGIIGETMMWDYVLQQNWVQNMANDLLQGITPRFRP